MHQESPPNSAVERTTIVADTNYSYNWPTADYFSATAEMLRDLLLNLAIVSLQTYRQAKNIPTVRLMGTQIISPRFLSRTKKILCALKKKIFTPISSGSTFLSSNKKKLTTFCCGKLWWRRWFSMVEEFTKKNNKFFQFFLDSKWWSPNKKGITKVSSKVWMEKVDFW